MFKLRKRIEIAGAHFLTLPYESKCQHVHGHNWIIHVEIEGEQITDFGMLMDFTHIKELVHLLDHKFIITEKQQEVLGVNADSILGRSIVTLPILNTTAECMAEYICRVLTDAINTDRAYTGHITKVTVQESEGNIACYQPNIQL